MLTQEIEQRVLDDIKASPKLRPMLISPTESGVHPRVLEFAVLGLNEEAGEVAGLACRECYKALEQSSDRWLEELGDVLWYLTAACIARGFTLEGLWKYNITKLEDRYGEYRKKELG